MLTNKKKIESGQVLEGLGGYTYDIRQHNKCNNLFK